MQKELSHHKASSESDMECNPVEAHLHRLRLWWADQQKGQRESWKSLGISTACLTLPTYPSFYGSSLFFTGSEQSEALTSNATTPAAKNQPQDSFSLKQSQLPKVCKPTERAKTRKIIKLRMLYLEYHKQKKGQYNICYIALTQQLDVAKSNVIILHSDYIY